MALEPREIAEQILAKPETERLADVTTLLEMVQAAIVIRSACRDKFFFSLSGEEDSGTKFDRLLKEMFGMTWVDKPKAGAAVRRRGRVAEARG